MQNEDKETKTGFSGEIVFPEPLKIAFTIDLQHTKTWKTFIDEADKHLFLVTENGDIYNVEGNKKTDL